MVAREQDANVEELLYQWGDEGRARAEELGLPSSSSVARMIAQQSVFERQQRGTRRKRPKVQTVKLRDGTVARICVCGRVFLGDELCDRCRNDPRPPEAITYGIETRNFRRRAMTAMSAVTVTIDEIASHAPGWMQKPLMLGYYYRVRDSKAAQRLRLRVVTYQEQKAAAVEYVREQLALRRSSAV